VQKPENHNETLRASKAFIADDYFSPHTSVGTGLSETELANCETILDIIPTLSHDQLIKLGLYMSHDGDINNKEVWRAWEEAVTEGMHLMNVKEISQA